MHLIYLNCQTRHLSLTYFKYAQNTYSCAESSPMPWTLSYKEVLRPSCSLVDPKQNGKPMDAWGMLWYCRVESSLGDSEGRNSLTL